MIMSPPKMLGKICSQFKQNTKTMYLYAGLAVLLLQMVATIWFAAPARAAGFNMQTGYYVGDGAAKSITGVGFRPELVIIKASTSAGVAVFRSDVMPVDTTAFFSAAADNTAAAITLDPDGFTLGTLASVNNTNILYRWMAFAGSDCSSSGYFCVGTYTGTGVASRTITTGFQPDMTTVKRSTAVAAHFRTSAMVANRTEFFSTTAANTTGAYIANSTATGFTVGATDNVNGGTYYYMTFRNSVGSFAQGSYVGNATAGTDITGLGFRPDALVIKNSTSTTTNNRRSIFYSDKHFGNLASYFGDAVADATTMVQATKSDGFTVGAGNNTNQNGETVYWFAFGGAPAMTGSGSFAMAQGTYAGTGTNRSITGVGFTPDLVIIKDNSNRQGVFRTSMMVGDTTAYLAASSANFAGGVISLDNDGFSLGTNATTNANGGTYQWQAFGGAYNPETKTGASDFAVGTYYGNGLTDRSVEDIPFQPNLIVTKRATSTGASFKTSAHTGVDSSSFGATADSTTALLSLDSAGFTLGVNASANTSGSLYYWFAFKSGVNFSVGTYTGSGIANAQIDAPFWSDLIWIKRSTSVAGVQRPSTLSGNITQFFANTANAANRVTDINASGFTVGTNTATNASGGTYHYAAWRAPPTGILGVDIVDGGDTSVGSPTAGFSTVGLVFGCTQSTATLGVTAQKIRITNMSSNASWALSVAPTNGPSSLWSNAGGTSFYDFNDTAGSPPGCSDGGDSDTYAGKLRVEPSTSMLTPQSGCTTTNISKGTDQSFSEGVVDAISLLYGAVGSNTECYWDLTGVSLIQTIPAEQAPGTYHLSLTLTILAQ